VSIIFVNEGSNCPQCLSWSSRYCDRIEIEILLCRHTQKHREASKCQWICVLEKHDPFLAFTSPFLVQFVHI